MNNFLIDLKVGREENMFVFVAESYNMHTLHIVQKHNLAGIKRQFTSRDRLTVT
jgi:hypothetical protein